jgi:hypothetical protein
LLARTTVRLFECHILAGLGFPVGGKGFVEFNVQLTGGVIRNVEQADLGLSGQGRQAEGSSGDESGETAVGGHEKLQKCFVFLTMARILGANRSNSNDCFLVC